MKRQSLFAACVLLAACGSTQHAAPPKDSLTPLEQACMRNPLDPATWEALAAALNIAGQRERAATMSLQAASLRVHDVQRDYATLKQARDEAAEDSMPRTQVRRLGPALVEVVRTSAASAPPPAPALRLEISNGNGVTGAAARMAHMLRADGINTVRLSNMRPFMVSVSRIEYPRGQRQMAQTLARRFGLQLQARAASPAYADMRIVLGRDQRRLK